MTLRSNRDHCHVRVPQSLELCVRNDARIVVSYVCGRQEAASARLASWPARGQLKKFSSCLALIIFKLIDALSFQLGSSESANGLAAITSETLSAEGLRRVVIEKLYGRSVVRDIICFDQIAKATPPLDHVRWPLLVSAAHCAGAQCEGSLAIKFPVAIGSYVGSGLGTDSTHPCLT